VTPVRIRRAIAGDAAEVADVWLRSFGSAYAFPPAHPDDDVRGWIRDLLIPGGTAWVAEGGGRVLALLAVSAGWVDQLYVDPEAHGRGIGRALLDHAKALQPDGLQLWTFQANERARRFYVRNGFVEVELTDGSTTEERQADVRLEWRPRRP
jgi:GNAT superfamily N-acetyltransferase